MGLLSFIAGGKNRAILSEIRNGSEPSVVVWKHTDEDFNTHSHLYLSPSEVAIFVYVNAKGETESLLLDKGGELQTNNIPFFRSITEKFSGGISRFHCAVYFVRTNLIADNKWGTPTQIGPLEDVRHYTFKLSLSGTYDLQIKDAKNLLDNILGYTSEPVTKDFLNSIVKEKIAFEVGNLITVLFQNPQFKASLPCIQGEMRSELGNAMGNVLNDKFSDEWGILFKNFTITGITDKYDELAQHYLKNNEGIQQTEMFNYQGESYGTIQLYNILNAAATNSNGMIGGVMGMGLGTGMTNGLSAQMGAVLHNASTTSSSSFGSWPGTSQQTVTNVEEQQRAIKRKIRAERLQELKELLEDGIITEEEFAKKKQEIINEI